MTRWLSITALIVVGAGPVLAQDVSGTTFQRIADRLLAALYRDARIRRLYHDWFGRYGEPLSPIVEAMYEFQAVSN